MKLTGHPDRAGEIRYQTGVTATAIKTEQGLQWDILWESDGLIRRTDRLSHISHWSSAKWGLRRAVTAKPLTLVKAAAHTGVLFGPDTSNNNWNNDSQVTQFVNALPGEGFSWVEAKCSEGAYYQDPYWQTTLQACRAAGIPCIPYHYVTTDNPARQAQTFTANGGGNIAMLDFEANSGDINNFWAVVNAFNAAGIQVVLSYIPRWYWSEIGSPDLSKVPGLISSAYPTTAEGYASTLYAEAGNEGWQPYGGATPIFWQFTDAANIDGISVDCNAYQGTADQLAALFNLGTQPVTQPSQSTPPNPAITKPADEAGQVSALFDQEFARYPFLNNNTAIEALGAIGAALKIPGYSNPIAPPAGT